MNRYQIGPQISPENSKPDNSEEAQNASFTQSLLDCGNREDLFERYHQTLKSFCFPNQSLYKNEVVKLLRNNGVIYDESVFYQSVQLTLLDSLQKGNILKIQAYYGYLNMTITIYNTNNDSPIFLDEAKSKSQGRSKYEFKDSFTKVYLVSYIYSKQNFKQVLKNIVKQYVVCRVFKILKTQSLFNVVQNFDITIFNNQIVFFEAMKYNQSIKINKETVNKGLQILFQLHSLNIVHMEINRTNLLTMLSQEQYLLNNFNQNAILKLDSLQFGKNIEVNPYLKDFQNYLVTSQKVLEQQQQQSISKDDTTQTFLSISQLYELVQVRILMLYKHNLYHILTNHLNLLIKHSLQTQTIKNRYSLCNQIVDFTAQLKQEEKLFCLKILPVLCIYKTQHPQPSLPQKASHPKYLQFVCQLQKYKNVRQIKVINSNLARQQRINDTFLELSRYQVFTSNQFTHKIRKEQIIRLLKFLDKNIDENNYVKCSLRLTLDWCLQNPINEQKINVFQQIISQCIIFRSQPYNNLFQKLQKIVALQINIVSKLKILINVLNCAGWIFKNGQEPLFFLSKLKALSLLNTVMMQIKTPLKQFKRVYLVIKKLTEYYNKKAIRLYRDLLNLTMNKQKRFAQSFKQQDLLLSIKEYVFGYMFLQVLQFHKQCDQQAIAMSQMLQNINTQKCARRGYFQLQPFHYSYFKLLIYTQKKQIVPFVFMLFLSILKNYVDLMEYSISAECKLFQMIYLKGNKGKSMFFQLIQKSVKINEQIDNVFFFMLLKRRGFQKVFFKNIRAYLKQSQYNLLSTLIPQNVTLTKFKPDNFDEYSRCFNFKTYLDYFYQIIIPLYCPKSSQNQTGVVCKPETKMILQQYLSKLESEIKKIQNTSQKIYYLWYLNLQRIVSFSVSIFEDQIDREQKNKMFLQFFIYCLKDVQASTTFQPWILYYAFQKNTLIHEYLLIFQYIKIQLLSKCILTNKILFLIGYIVKILCLIKNVDLMAELFIIFSWNIKATKFSSASILNVFNDLEMHFITLRQNTEKWYNFIEDIYYQSHYNGNNINLVFNILLFMNMSIESLYFHQIYHRVIRSIQQIKQPQKKFLLDKLYVQYLKQDDLHVRKLRFVEKMSLKLDLKINQIKKVLKKLVTNTKKKTNIMNRVDTYCGLLSKYIQKYSQNLQIMK